LDNSISEALQRFYFFASPREIDIKEVIMDKNKQEQLNININLDTTPILYTDNIILSTNEDGFIMDVCQKIGASNQLRVVARIGMSRVHAKKLVEKMGKLLALTEGKSQTGDRDKKN
jgi:hypothetical protein